MVVFSALTLIAKQPVCEVSADTVAFGAYQPLTNTLRNTSSAIAVSCTGKEGDTVYYTLILNIGSGSSYASRQMSSGSYTLLFNLYTDAARTQIWGDGTGGTVTISGSMVLTDSTVTRTHIVYGRIPGSQRGPGAGSYIDPAMVVRCDYSKNEN